MSTSHPPPPQNEEDVDDLDDLLDSFTPAPSSHFPSSHPPPTSSPPSTQPHASSSSTAPPKPPDQGNEEQDLDADFAAELEKGMAAMMAELSSSSGLPLQEDESTKALREAWDRMLISELEGLEQGADSTTTGRREESGPSGDEVGDAFQAAVQRTMEQLGKSEESSKDAEESSNDPLTTLLSQLGSALDSSAVNGEGDEEGLETLLQGMMSTLLSKDILYEPLSDLSQKYPVYLEEHKDDLHPHERERYTKQYDACKKIVAIFDRSDSSEDGAEIAALMSEMQGYGAPPKEIMGDLPEGWELGEDGVPKVPEGCRVM